MLSLPKRQTDCNCELCTTARTNPPIEWQLALDRPPYRITEEDDKLETSIVATTGFDSDGNANAEALDRLATYVAAIRDKRASKPAQERRDYLLGLYDAHYALVTKIEAEKRARTQREQRPSTETAYMNEIVANYEGDLLELARVLKTDLDHE
jgi:hypothetical protein